MRCLVLTSVMVCGLSSLAGMRAAWADPVLVSLRPTAGGVCACDFSNKVIARFKMTPGSDFEGTRAVEARIGKLDAAGVNLEDADFSHAVLPGARFAGAVLRAASFRGAKLHASDFTRAELAEADFTDAELVGADLETALHLTQAQLQGACGDSETKLPEGLWLPACGLDAEPLPEARHDAEDGGPFEVDLAQPGD